MDSILQLGRGGLYARQNYIPMQELELKMQGGLCARGGVIAGFYGISSLVPRLSWGRGKESLVTTACACANPYQKNMVSQFSQQNGLSRVQEPTFE